MAAINNVISLGLGSPASIAYLVEFGIGTGSAVPPSPVVTPSDRIMEVREENRTYIAEV